MPAGAFCELPDSPEAMGYATLLNTAAFREWRDIPLSHCIGPPLCAATFCVPAERFMAMPQTHKRSARTRPAEIKNELRDSSRAIIITSPLRTEIGRVLLAFALLGYFFHSITKWFGAFRAMNSSIQHVIPCDVGIEMVSFGLVLEQRLQFSQFLGLFLG